MSQNSQGRLLTRGLLTGTDQQVTVWPPVPSTGRRLAVALLVLCCLTGAGCQKMRLRAQKPDSDEVGEMKARTLSFIGDQVAVTGLHQIQIESVGLVVNLDGTGGDSPPSLYRRLLIEDMQKRGVRSPQSLLQDPNSTLVVVRATLPPSIRVGERFDVEVAIPEASEASSLRGGYLLEANLAEQAMVPGKGPKSGHTMGKAEGPILVSTGDVGEGAKASVLKRGRIPGGGVYTGGLLKQDRLLGLYLKNELRGGRQTERISEAIGRRFFDMVQGRKVPMAKAKTDQYIELRVPERYRDNYMHYLSVIRAIAINETTVEQRERLERLRRKLFTPETAGRGALELEAIGSPEAKLILREGVEHPNAEVRFYAADALAYMGDSAGARVLVAAARDEPAFRVFALAALATLDRDRETIESLRGLMTQPTLEESDGVQKEIWSAETRYGAFRALESIDRNHEIVKGDSIYGDSVLRSLETPDGEKKKGKNPRPEFVLYLIDSPGEPLVHMTRHRKSEVTLFGSEQKLKTPISLEAGHILVTAPSGSDVVTISRFEPGRESQRVQTSTRLAEVVRAVGKLDGSYPDVAQLLVMAEKQSNLEGRLEFDALPKAGRIYYRDKVGTIPGELAQGGTKVRVGNEEQAPNIFPSLAPAKKSKEKFANGPVGSDADAADADSADGDFSDSTAEADEESSTPARKRGLLNLLQRK